MVAYLQRSLKLPTSDDTVQLLNAGSHGRMNAVGSSDHCARIYAQCDEEDWLKMNYVYWILPWNPMGSLNVLSQFVKWAFYEHG